MNLIPFPNDASSLAHLPPHPQARTDDEWLQGYREEMNERGLSSETIRAYTRAFRDFLTWIHTMPGGERGFYPALVTKTAIKEYFAGLKPDYSISHQIKVKAALSLALDYFGVEGDPVAGQPLKYVNIPPEPILQPKRLTKRQRFILKTLNDQYSSPRNNAMFQCGMYAAFRVSELADLNMKDIKLSKVKMEVTIGVKNEKRRTITLPPEARHALEYYLYSDHPQARRNSKFAESSDYVFLSQRGGKLTENAIDRWFKELVKKAPVDQYEEVKDVNWHRLRHDVAHRLLDKGMRPEELAIFLGHIKKDGTPSLQTTTRYTMPSADDISAQLLAFD